MKVLGYRILKKAMLGSIWRVIITVSKVESERKDHPFIFPYYNIYTIRNQIRKNKRTCNRSKVAKKGHVVSQNEKEGPYIGDLMMI